MLLCFAFERDLPLEFKTTRSSGCIPEFTFMRQHTLSKTIHRRLSERPVSLQFYSQSSNILVVGYAKLTID